MKQDVVPWFSKCGPAGSFSSPWDPIRSAGSQTAADFPNQKLWERDPDFPVLMSPAGGSEAGSGWRTTGLKDCGSLGLVCGCPG